MSGGYNPYAQRLAALEQVSLAASRVLDPRELARIALDETIRILGAERAFLFLTTPHRWTRQPVGSCRTWAATPTATTSTS